MDTSTKPGVAMRDAQQSASVALHAAAAVGLTAVADAAANAAKAGGSSSEFKATLVGLGITALAAVLHALSVVPGPWMLPAIAGSAALAVGAYAITRGTVKAAALAAAAAAVVSVAPKLTPLVDVGEAIAAGELGVAVVKLPPP